MQPGQFTTVLTQEFVGDRKSHIIIQSSNCCPDLDPEIPFLVYGSRYFHCWSLELDNVGHYLVSDIASSGTRSRASIIDYYLLLSHSRPASPARPRLSSETPPPPTTTAPQVTRGSSGRVPYHPVEPGVSGTETAASYQSLATRPGTSTSTSNSNSSCCTTETDKKQEA